jgi:hypothetical protein
MWEHGSVDDAERDVLIERYESGTAEVKAALDGITEAELDSRPGDDEWRIDAAHAHDHADQIRRARASADA